VINKTTDAFGHDITPATIITAFVGGEGWNQHFLHGEVISVARGGRKVKIQVIRSSRDGDRFRGQEVWVYAHRSLVEVHPRVKKERRS
jgi:hypothetical protein